MKLTGNYLTGKSFTLEKIKHNLRKERKTVRLHPLNDFGHGTAISVTYG
jgi:hypothetical protein